MDRFLSRLGYGGLGQPFYRFFRTHLGFVIFTNLHGVFINTLLMRVSGDSGIAMKFNLISYLVMGPMMALAVGLTKKTSPVFTLRIGVGMYLGMYLAFFLGLSNLARVMPLMAIFSGLGAGSYYYANNLGFGGYLTDAERDRGFGLSSMGEGIAALAVPFLSGSIISRFEGLAGYLIVFGLGMAMAAVTVIFSMSLAPLPSMGNKTRYREALHVSFCNGPFCLMMFSNLIKGIRAGLLGFFLSLILYEVVQSEFTVGLNTLLSGGFGILGAMIYGRVVREKQRFPSMLISTTVLIAASLLLLNLTPAAIIVFSILNSFCGYFLANPTMTLYYAVIQLPEYEALQGEFHGIKELFITVGRAAGILFAMTCGGIVSPVLMVVLLTLTQYPMIAMLLPVQKLLAARKAANNS
ncbi:MAG: MFS transporter [Oscillospiraceae bacterium]|jgi:YQGE family putative transporter|nr:MFS transporter [Oscillospiraceae bacterium]